MARWSFMDRPMDRDSSLPTEEDQNTALEWCVGRCSRLAGGAAPTPSGEEAIPVLRPAARAGRKGAPCPEGTLSPCSAALYVVGLIRSPRTNDSRYGCGGRSRSRSGGRRPRASAQADPADPPRLFSGGQGLRRGSVLAAAFDYLSPAGESATCQSIACMTARTQKSRR